MNMNKLRLWFFPWIPEHYSHTIFRALQSRSVSVDHDDQLVPVDDAFIHTNSPLPSNNGPAHKDGVNAKTSQCRSRDIIVKFPNPVYVGYQNSKSKQGYQRRKWHASIQYDWVEKSPVLYLHFSPFVQMIQFFGIGLRYCSHVQNIPKKENDLRYFVFCFIHQL